MKTTVSFQDFEHSLSACYNDHFSGNGKRALFDFLTELEESTGVELELDPIALCTEFSEYLSFDMIQVEYPEIKSRDDLAEHTMVIDFETGLIIQNF